MVLCTARPRCIGINDEKQIMHNNAGRNNDERDMNHQALKGHTTEGKTITVIRMWRSGAADQGAIQAIGCLNNGP